MITLLILFSFSFTQAQYVEQAQLPKYDCKIANWKKFESQKFIIVTPNKIDSLLNNRVKVHSSWYDDTCLVKTEAEMSIEDYKNHLWILGTIADFENWDMFNLPIQKINDGFRFNNIDFTDSLDGIGIVDTNRIIFVGNSSQTIFGLREPDLAYGYDFVLTQDNKKTYFGNFQGDSVFLSNIDWLKETNYLRHHYNYIDLLVSKKYEKPLDLDSIYLVLQDFAEEFCSLFSIEIPIQKPLALIHKYQPEITNMTAFWDGACGGHIYGFQVWNEIHTEGFGFDLIKHEFGHHLFNENFETRFPPIIAEGVIEYYFNMLDLNTFVKNLELTKVYSDSLNFIEFITDEANFFGCGKYRGKGIGYGISGIFVKYLIDSYGIHDFKNYCNQKNHLSSIEKIFGMKPDELILDFKEWTNNQ